MMKKMVFCEKIKKLKKLRQLVVRILFILFIEEYKLFDKNKTSCQSILSKLTYLKNMNKTVEVLKGLSENKMDVLSYLLKGNKSIGISMIPTNPTEKPTS